MTDEEESHHTAKIRAAGYSPDSGPAFPQHVVTPVHPGGYWTTVGGMSQRDYIAAQVLMGICATLDSGPISPGVITACASEAYAMLAAQ